MKRERKIKVLPQLVDLLGADSKNVFLLFSDLCGSTQYKQDCIQQGQPDINWIIRQYFFLQRCADLVRSYGGSIVKTIGDELFAYFDGTVNPENVLKCAIEIIQSFDNVEAYKGKSQLEAKVSLDFGLTFNGSLADTVPYDPIGGPVDRCARLNSQAGNNDIIFSGSFLRALEGKSSKRKIRNKYSYDLNEEELKGLGVTKFYRISAK